MTEANRAEYVSLLAAWHMERATAEQYESFAAGFRVLCEGPAMSLFNAQVGGGEAALRRVLERRKERGCACVYQAWSSL